MANPWDNAACMEIDRFLDSRGIRHSPPTLGSTLGSPPGGHGHTAGSNHYPEAWGGPRGSTGQARDYGTFGSDCQAIADALEHYARQGIIVELIWTRRLPRTGTYYKRGVAYTPSIPLAYQHRNHVHAAIAVGRHLPNVGPGPVPTPTPTPAPVPQPRKRSDPMFVIKGDRQLAVFATNDVTKQWLETERLRDIAVMRSENKKVDVVDQDYVDNIPLVGLAPPGYAPNGKFAEQH